MSSNEKYAMRQEDPTPLSYAGITQIRFKGPRIILLVSAYSGSPSGCLIRLFINYQYTYLLSIAIVTQQQKDFDRGFSP